MADRKIKQIAEARREFIRSAHVVPNLLILHPRSADELADQSRSEFQVLMDIGTGRYKQFMGMTIRVSNDEPDFQVALGVQTRF